MGLEGSALTGAVVDAGLAVHRALGPGLLESVYESCLCHELQLRGLRALRQVILPITYREMRVEGAFRMDLVVEERVVVEVKAVEALTAVHGAQVRTYLRLSGLGVGLLMNFNVVLYKQGVKRFVV